MVVALFCVMPSSKSATAALYRDLGQVPPWVEQNAAARAFADAVAGSDAKAAAKALELLEHHGGWALAMRRVAGLCPSNDFRRRFLRVWVSVGDSWRGHVDDDMALINALRALLPRYRGGPKQLYRGESVSAWRRRRHGLAWTKSLRVARSFAEAFGREFPDGSALITATANAEAIIAAIPRSVDRYAEREYVVDRRLLSGVKMIERFPGASALPR